ncbi:MLO-like protein 11 [Artemisia annua]|uniref:MLO-like protein n=1 Tax=Artemisia annua TaxID=35608 RepID=A0A2U1M4D9_ARTAN|nr:MLO-like protein 11 [Artemisia annua]
MDTLRGIVVDFFTVWLPAPTLSFISFADDANGPDSIDALKGLLGSIPDNAFQKTLAGKDWNVGHRVASVVVGGIKLAGVGFISSIGASARKFLNPALVNNQQNKRSPILKTTVVYSGFLGTSANLRYQQWIDLTRFTGLQTQKSESSIIINQIIECANPATIGCNNTEGFTGLQTQKSESSINQTIESANTATIGCNTTEEAGVDEIERVCITSQYPTQAVRMISTAGASQLTSQSEDPKIIDGQVDVIKIRKEVKYSAVCSKKPRLSEDGNVISALSSRSSNKDTVCSIISTDDKFTENGGDVSKSVPDVASAIEDLLEQTSKIHDQNSPERWQFDNFFSMPLLEVAKWPGWGFTSELGLDLNSEDPHSAFGLSKHWTRSSKSDENPGGEENAGIYGGFSETQTESQLVLLLGAKLQHVIATLALESAGITGYFTEARLKPRDELFWFKKPQLLLRLIHFILFQNAFELASFFWFWWQFGYDSCFLKHHTLVYIRLILGFAAQFLCSYSTLPLYALVTQMGTNYKAALIPQRIRETIKGWRKEARRRRKKEEESWAYTVTIRLFKRKLAL